MFADLLMLSVAFAIASMAMFSMRVALAAFVFLYGTYPRLLAVGVGEQGFAITGPRLFAVLLVLAYTARVLMNSPVAWRGLNIFFGERKLCLALASLIGAKVCGNIVNSRFDVASLGALGTEMLMLVFVPILVVTYVRSHRDIYVIFASLAAAVLLNEIVVGIEAAIGHSIFQGLVAVQFATGVDVDLTAGRVREGAYRAMGLMSNPLVLARLFCISLPGLLVLAVRRVNSFMKYPAVLALVGIVPAVVLTDARAAVLMCLAVMSYAVFTVTIRDLSKGLRYALVAVVVIAGLAVGYAVLDTLVSLVVESSGEQGIRSAQSRIVQYAVALPMLAESPWFGFGFARNYDVLLDIGNIDGYYLFTALQGGIVGLAALLGVLARSIILTGTRDSAETTDALAIAWVVRTTLFVLAVMMIVYSLHNSVAYLSLYVGLAMALRNMARSKEMASQPTTNRLSESFVT